MSHYTFKIWTIIMCPLKREWNLKTQMNEKIFLKLLYMSKNKQETQSSETPMILRAAFST